MMEVFNIRNLRNRASDLVREAEHGKLSLVTKHGKPIFIAVPFNEALLQSGIRTFLAVALFADQKVGLAGAAHIAGVSSSEMMDILAERQIPLVDYGKEELLEELQHFSERFTDD